MEETVPTSSEKLSFKQILFSFSGRIGRATYWGVYIVMLIISLFLILVILGIRGDGEGIAAIGLIIYFLYIVISIWIELAVQVKRWHDRNKSGWMVLINFIPLVGAIWAFVELGFLRGTTGPNQYGEDPLQTFRRDGEQIVA